MPGKREAKKEQRRAEILAVALGQFAQRGYHGTSVREIARELGITEAALYRYFPSKADLLRVLFAQSTVAGAEPQAPLVEDASVEACLVDLGLAFLRTMQEHRTLFRFNLSLLFVGDEREGMQGPFVEMTGRYSVQLAQWLHRKLPELEITRCNIAADSYVKALLGRAAILSISEEHCSPTVTPEAYVQELARIYAVGLGRGSY